MLQLEKTFLAIRIHVIRNTGAPKPDGMVQDLLQCGVQALKFVTSQR